MSPSRAVKSGTGTAARACSGSLIALAAAGRVG